MELITQSQRQDIFSEDDEIGLEDLEAAAEMYDDIVSRLATTRPRPDGQ